MIAINIENLKTLKYHIFLKNIRFLLFIREIFIYRSFLVLLKLDQNTKSKNLCSSVSMCKFRHTATMSRFGLFIQAAHCDTFKQNRLAKTGIYKVFNSTFLCVLLKLNV